MSGPKSSRYKLTAEQLKRILEEQERPENLKKSKERTSVRKLVCILLL